MSSFSDLRTTSGEFFNREGVWPGCLISIIDLGTQEREYQGQKSKAHMIFLVWELIECQVEGEKFLKSNYMWGQQYTLSMHIKATLRRHLEEWEGSPFADGRGIDLAKFLGTYATLSLYKNGGSFCKLQGLGPAPGAHPKPGHQPFIWEISSGQPIPNHDWLPDIYGESVANVIQKSDEWRAKTGNTAPPFRQQYKMPETEKADIPF